MKRTPIKRVNKARKAKEFRRTYGSKDRVEFVKALPCSVLGCLATPSDNAHITGDGAGRKADADTCIPLCRAHHDEFDAGHETFAAKYRFDAVYHAHLTELAWSMANGDAV
jgi:hypothetical protein